jgi:hypothetical protein
MRGLRIRGENMNKLSMNSIRFVIVALLASLLTPVTVAMSVDNITKTFTVRDANDAPLVDGQVRLWSGV